MKPSQDRSLFLPQPLSLEERAPSLPPMALNSDGAPIPPARERPSGAPAGCVPALAHFRAATLCFLIWILALLPIAAAETAEVFPSPEAAVTALAAAVGTKDSARLRAIFGPGLADIKNPDRVQATNEFAHFAAALDATNRVVRESDTKCVLELGKELWPFPIPLIKSDNGWFFDTARGKEELLNRRIGRNELEALAVMRAYVDAQREYASRDHTGDEVLEYARHLLSSPGTKDGLYWPPDLDGTLSPLGPLVAEAQGEGYNLTAGGRKLAPKPFHGYYFKILSRQGKHAPGGKYNYIINGHMIGGFAMVAWPARYGDSGIMTFIVNQQGRVYQKDLGPKTDQLAPAIKLYDPDSSWELSPN
jgi:hypothetical protein